MIPKDKKIKSSLFKLNCFVFVDFIKGFDSVWRVGLWSKILMNKINSKQFQLLFNMYNELNPSHSVGLSQVFPLPAWGTTRGKLISCLICFIFKLLRRFHESKYGAKISKRYNQVPHLTQDTSGKARSCSGISLEFGLKGLS